MPNPRAVHDFEGIGANFATFRIDGVTIVHDPTKPGGSTAVGLAVNEMAGGVVQLTADGQSVKGKLVLVEGDGFCNVQVEGFTDLPGGAAATLTPGTKALGALGAGGARGHIRSAVLATATYDPVAVNEAARPGPQIINADNPAKVVVQF